VCASVVLRPSATLSPLVYSKIMRATRTLLRRTNTRAVRSSGVLTTFVSYCCSKVFGRMFMVFGDCLLPSIDGGSEKQRRLFHGYCLNGASIVRSPSFPLAFVIEIILNETSLFSTHLIAKRGRSNSERGLRNTRTAIVQGSHENVKILNTSLFVSRTGHI